MILVLFLCAILIILILIIFAIIFSTIRIKIRKLEFTNIHENKMNYKIKVSMYFLSKLKWLSLNLDNKKMKKMFTKMHLEKIDIKKIERDMQLSDIKAILGIAPKISYLDLNIKVGLENILLTTYVIPFLCTIISMILPKITEKKDFKNVKYRVEPIYKEKNLYDIQASSNIEIKVINILNSGYQIFKNRKNLKQKSYKEYNRKNIIKCIT